MSHVIATPQKMSHPIGRRCKQRPAFTWPVMHYWWSYRLVKIASDTDKNSLLTSPTGIRLRCSLTAATSQWGKRSSLGCCRRWHVQYVSGIDH